MVEIEAGLSSTVLLLEGEEILGFGGLGVASLIGLHIVMGPGV